jgi:cyclopropane fatty-acyl-phospholipid synthase-like methyltransferase
MMYSSAIFESVETSLEVAAVAKLDRICQKLSLTPDDHVVEIGTGWGGFAIHAAQHYGCRVTTTTISKQQYDYARQSVAEKGLEDRITLLLQDYRDLEGNFDKLVSIEMIEAVGHEFHETYFRKCCELLKPDGQMLLQAITIADAASGDHDRRPGIRGVSQVGRLYQPQHLSRRLRDVSDRNGVDAHEAHRHANRRPGRHRTALCSDSASMA